MISYGRFANADANLFLIKDYVYAVSDEGIVYAVCKIRELNNNIVSIVIPLICSGSLCYYSIGHKNQNNKLVLYLYINNAAITCTAGVTNSFYKEFTNLIIYLDNISCHYKDVIICFYENDSNELVSSHFTVDVLNLKIEYSSSYSKPLEGPKIIKSIISSDNTKYYVCYINNEKGNNCLIYYINTNEWSDPINFLNNCFIRSYSFTLQYFDSLNYYIVSCLQSQTDFSFIKLNNNFEIINDNTKGN